MNLYKRIPIGTRSLIFGVHQVFIHPWWVALAWTKLYGFPTDPRLWVAFLVHDWGYAGARDLDKAEGEEHPLLGARIMGRLFDRSRSGRWYYFTLCHSRFFAKKHSMHFSRLCVADKLAVCIMPRWLFLLQTNIGGEIHEYMEGETISQWEWITKLQKYVRTWVEEHKDLKEDHWTGTSRDVSFGVRRIK